MDKFFKSLTNKKVRYGSFSTLSIVIVVALLIVVNMVFDQLNLSMDLTSDKVYSISQETKDALKDIDAPITVYPLFKTGDTSSYIGIYREILEEYPSANKNITIEYMDPYLYPQFVQQFATEGEVIAEGSIIVESGEKFKVIPQNQLLSLGFDSSTYTQYVKSMDVEPQVTNAIRYVVSGEKSTVYYVSNHNEYPLSEELQNQLAYANFELKDIDLMLTEEMPEDCDLLLVTTPAKDWSEVEADLVRSYLQNDGRAAFFVDMVSYELTNLAGVLETYGVAFSKSVVIEANYKNMYMGNPIYIVPDYKAHEITNSLIERSYNAIIAMAMPIETLSLKKNSTTVDPIMVSSSESYSKDTSTSSQTIGKESGDASGPFSLAVTVTDSYYSDKQHITKLFVMGTSSILSSELDTYSGGNDVSFVLNGLKWTQDNTQDIYIRPKTTTATEGIEMSFNQAVVIVVFSVIIIPLAILITGIVIWLRRRNS